MEVFCFICLFSKMINMDNLQFAVRFLCSFFGVFQAYIIEIRVQKDKVEGVIMYVDKDIQKFVWYYTSLSHVKKAFQLLDILIEKEWVSIDKIIISKQELIKYLENIGWGYSDIDGSICFLSSLKINMVDEGKETDSFFVHF